MGCPSAATASSSLPRNLDRRAGPELVDAGQRVERERRLGVVPRLGGLPVRPLHRLRDTVQDLRDERMTAIAVRHHREPAAGLPVRDQVAPEALVAAAVPEPIALPGRRGTARARAESRPPSLGAGPA